MRVVDTVAEREQSAKDRVLGGADEQEERDPRGVWQRRAERLRVDHDAPEQERGHEEPGVLDDVDRRALDRGVVERGDVPGVQADDIERRRDERPAHEVDERAEGGVARERAYDRAADGVRQAAQERPDRRAREQQRRGDDQQEQLLDHVDAEQIERERVDRRCEGREQRDLPEEEQRRAPERPAAPGGRATQIHDGREEREGDEDYRRTVVSTMIATNSSARYSSE